MTTFELSNTECIIKLHSSLFDYTLLYSPYLFVTFNGSPFLFEPPTIHGKRFCISASTLRHYPGGLREIDPNLQYINVGAGLDEFTEKLGASSLLKTPVVIDPANYELMAEMLGYLRSHVSERDRIKVDGLVHLCQVILEGRSIQLINSTLGEAIKQSPELFNFADKLVDIGGPQAYPETEGSTSVLELEGKLVKEGGIMVYSQSTYQKIDGKLTKIL
ncbi:hypothetical protein HYX12_05080 [Candidatus Woesearchaeota archaeon]|nr:hypothetical protein [Candidatus Woesearchaeota archaeon]